MYHQLPASLRRSTGVIAFASLLLTASDGTRAEAAHIDPALPEPVRAALQQLVLTIRMDPIHVEMAGNSRFRIAEPTSRGETSEMEFVPTCLWRVTGEVACATPVPTEHIAFRMADAQNIAQGSARLFPSNLTQPSHWESRQELRKQKPKSTSFLLPVTRLADGKLELSALRCSYFLGLGQRDPFSAAKVGTYAACDPPARPYDVVATVGLSEEGEAITYISGALWPGDEKMHEFFTSPVPLHEVLRFVDGERFPGKALFSARAWDGELEQGRGKRLPKRNEHGNLSCGPELHFKVQNTEVRARSDYECNVIRLDLLPLGGQRLRLFDSRKSEDEYLFDEEDGASDDMVAYSDFFVGRERSSPWLSQRSPALVQAWARAFLTRDGDAQCALYYPIGFVKYSGNRSWRKLPGLAGEMGYPFGCVDPSLALGQVRYGLGQGSSAIVDLAGYTRIVGIAHIEAVHFNEGVHSFLPGMPQRGQELTVGGIAYVPADPEPFWISEYAGKTPALRVRKELPAPGERMHLFGYPGRIGPVHSRCLFVGRLRPDAQYQALCHLTTVKMDAISSLIAKSSATEVSKQLSAIYQGNSGGPFVDERGAFLGAVSNGATFLVTRPASPFADVISLIGFSPAHQLLDNPAQRLGENASRSEIDERSTPRLDLQWRDDMITDCNALMQRMKRSAGDSVLDSFSAESYAWLVREDSACNGP